MLRLVSALFAAAACLNNENDKCTVNGRGGTYEGTP